MDIFQQLSELFRSFPGIGPRQAERFVYHVITSPADFRNRLIDTLTKAHAETSQCSLCMRYFPRTSNAISDSKLCTICSQPDRDNHTLLIVARDRDCTVIEKSGSYDGYYFILGGTIPILEKNPDTTVRVRELLERINRAPDLSEIIIAMNQTAEGENTIEHLVRTLKTIPRVASGVLRVSMLGRGIATGQEIEYSDGATLRSALKGRSPHN